MIDSLDELGPEPRQVADRFLAVAAAELPAAEQAAVVADMVVHLCLHLDADSDAGDVAAQVRGIGPVATASRRSLRSRLGRLARGLDPVGIGQRVARTWWNPADERLLQPRAVGLGWDLNLGAVAVRLGLIEPDAEAEPFSATPQRAFQLTALLPAALAGATVLHYLARGRSLPARLPSHWDAAGAPDRWTSRRRAVVTDLAATVLPALWAGAVGAAADRPGPARAGSLALATALGSAGAAVTVWRTLGDRGRWWAPVALMGVVAGSAGAVLTGLALAGRTAERRADLGGGHGRH